MALFLSESLAQRVPTVTLEEGLIGLMEVMEEGQALTEALYKADFVMYLREAEGEAAASTERVSIGTEKYKNKGGTDSSMNFLERAWEAIKNFGRKVWQKLSALFQAIKNKLSLWWNKLSGNKADNFKVPKKGYNELKTLIVHIENNVIIMARKFKEKSDLDDAINNEKTRWEEADKKFESTEGTMEVSKSELVALAKKATDLLAKAERSKGDQDKEKNTLDAQVSAYKKSLTAAKATGADATLVADKEKIEKAMAIAQINLRISSALGTLNAKVVSQIMALVNAGAQDSKEMSDDDMAAIRKSRGA